MERHVTLSRRPAKEQPPADMRTTRPPIPQMTTPTYLYLLYHPVFLVLLLTVVLPQSLLVHREGRSLPSTGSVPSSGDGPSSRFSHVGKLSLIPFLYLTVIRRCDRAGRSVDVGKIATSKNDNWSDETCGVVFSDDRIKEGVFP
jgi:hypothetical protein